MRVQRPKTESLRDETKAAGTNAMEENKETRHWPARVAALLIAGSAAGFIAGSLSQHTTDLRLVVEQPRLVEGARVTVRNAFSEAGAKISPDKVNKLLDSYHAKPDAWDNKVFDADVMEALDKLMARTEQARVLRSRELIGSYDRTLVDQAWEHVEQEDFSSAIVDGDDQIQIRVEQVGGLQRCWIVPDETHDDADWMNNLDFGDEDILSVKQYNTRDESCGCEDSGWWGCNTYYSCPVHVTLGHGYDGFVKPYNDMRVSVWNQVSTTCANSDEYVFAGWSRGGSIAAVLAAAFHEEGLLQASKMKLVTFGAGRALDDGTSDRVHGKFTQWRMVYKTDLVPSVPYDWMGYKHFGEMRCFECTYTEGRDQPFLSFGIDDHSGYCLEWGDGTCT